MCSCGRSLFVMAGNTPYGDSQCILVWLVFFLSGGSFYENVVFVFLGCVKEDQEFSTFSAVGKKEIIIEIDGAS